MHPFRNVSLLVFVLVTFALLPGRVYAAAPPRVVGLAELAGNPVEVVISTKHLTLIHFETGEVSMVAIGDPDIVSVTVKGPDVLLKALSSSGSTNAFIWQGGRYTQWIFTVRQNSRDSRVIIVKDVAASAGARVESKKSPEGTAESGKPATSSTTAARASGQPGRGTVASSTTASPSTQQPFTGPGPEHQEATDQTRNGKTETSGGSASQSSDSAATLQGGTLIPAGVVFAVTTQVIDGRLLLYYVLENNSEAALLTDILRLRIFDASGNQLSFGINRGTQGGYLGRIESSSVEYGVIAVDAPQKLVMLEWRLIQFRSGLQQLVRVKLLVP